MRSRRIEVMGSILVAKTLSPIGENSFSTLIGFSKRFVPDTLLAEQIKNVLPDLSTDLHPKQKIILIVALGHQRKNFDQHNKNVIRSCYKKLGPNDKFPNLCFTSLSKESQINREVCQFFAQKPVQEELKKMKDSDKQSRVGLASVLAKFYNPTVSKSCKMAS